MHAARASNRAVARANRCSTLVCKACMDGVYRIAALDQHEHEHAQIIRDGLTHNDFPTGSETGFLNTSASRVLYLSRYHCMDRMHCIFTALEIPFSFTLYLFSCALDFLHFWVLLVFGYGILLSLHCLSFRILFFAFTWSGFHLHGWVIILLLHKVLACIGVGLLFPHLHLFFCALLFLR